MVVVQLVARGVEQRLNWGLEGQNGHSNIITLPEMAESGYKMQTYPVASYFSQSMYRVYRLTIAMPLV